MGMGEKEGMLKSTRKPTESTGLNPLLPGITGLQNQEGP